ncbi:MAG: DUF2513 domain-containing protein [Firmicutes bacterium]|nr:DUF2513 domain-containing protein [Bacillota bacterium]
MTDTKQITNLQQEIEILQSELIHLRNCVYIYHEIISNLKNSDCLSEIIKPIIAKETFQKNIFVSGEEENMRLNHDCLRDVLLQVESNAFGVKLKIKDLAKSLPQYSENDLTYTCIKLKEAGFLEVKSAVTYGTFTPVVIEIADLTFNGHEFLATIRNENIWNQVKQTAKKVGDLTLPMLMKVATEIINQKLNQLFQQ